MKRRQLISAREAVPAKAQHKKPCSDCPWAQTALNGWLGDLTPEEWIQSAHGEAAVECHALTGVQCAGIAIYRANNYKTPRDPAILRLPRDTKLVFEKRDEFMAHHCKAPETPKRAATPERAKMATAFIQEKFEEIEELINEVEGETRTVTREEYREFLEELGGAIETRLLALDIEDAGNKSKG